MNGRSAAVISALLLACGASPPSTTAANEETVPIALPQLSYVQPITLSDLLDKNSAVRRAENALLLLSSDWCKYCSELAVYFEGLAEYAQRQGLTSEQLYFARLGEEFNGNLDGLLLDPVRNFPAVVYLRAEEGSRLGEPSPNREAGRVEPGTAWDNFFGAMNLVKLQIAGLASGIISQYNGSQVIGLVY